MEFSQNIDGCEHGFVDLFRKSFTASEGAGEGDTIANLVSGLLAERPTGGILPFLAMEQGAILGGVVFSRLVYPEDARHVALLSPMAVDPDVQGQGVGQGLIAHALEVLGDDGVDVVMTYGDPAFYGKVGFAPISETQAAAPHTLSMPQGWIGQALNGEFTPLHGPSKCAHALNDPALW